MSWILAALHFQYHIGMTSLNSPAAKLLSTQSVELATQAMKGSVNITHLAAEHKVSASLSANKRIGHLKRSLMPLLPRLRMTRFYFIFLSPKHGCTKSSWP
ncbi:MAG: hypothetical protein K9K35_16345 [Rhodoferax sp.]|nr:hypothetical protein [Rhodoferax sp.]MCF8211167.1 hypothetical protein [Rhodoferax sp.]